MNVLHVIPSISLQAGGPSTALPLIVRALRLKAVGVTVATTDDDGPNARMNVPLGQKVEGADGATYFFFDKKTEFYKFSWGLKRWLVSHVRDFDVVHIHALFSYSSIAAGQAAHRNGIPYVVRPLGVLNQWGMQNRRRRLKRLSLRWIELPILRRAAAIHYTSEAERREAGEAHAQIRQLRSAVIPIPIDADALSKQESSEALFAAFPTLIGKPLILFLSRITEKKGLEMLLEALAEVRAAIPDATLLVAGQGEGRYLRLLQGKAEQLGVAEAVIWSGLLSGSMKAAAFAAATVFVLPSYSENFAIAAAEALAAGVPTIVSDQVAISEEIAAEEAGLVVPCEPRALADALRRLLMDGDMRARLSERGGQLARTRFSFEAVGAALLELYSACISRGSGNVGAN